MEKRRRFSEKFKRETVQMTTGANLSIKQIATDVGIHANVLSRWCQVRQRDGAKAFRGQQDAAPLWNGSRGSGGCV